MSNMEIKEEQETEKVKIIDFTFVITTLICILPIIAGVYFWNQLPDRLARHFDMNGNPDGFGSKWEVLIIFPVLIAGLNIFENIFTKKKNMPKKMRLFQNWIAPVITIFVYITTFSYNLKGGFTVDVIFCTNLFVGLVFTILGNYLPKTPVELINLPELSGVSNVEEETVNYKKRTVRYIGKIFFIFGLLLIITGFTPIKTICLFSIIGVLLLSIPVCIVVSQSKVNYLK